MSGCGIVSRVTPVHTAVRNCTRDEGRPFEVGNQVLISSHRKLLLGKHLRKGVVVPSLHNDPEHWRKRAKEARALAEKMTDAVSKKGMMEVAEKYDEVAARAVERLAKRTPQSK
jgi:hypothetical protein